MTRVLLATIRHDGSLRLSLVEPPLHADQLVIPTLDGDAKATDLRRDRRCSIHALVAHRTHDEGEFKASATAEEILLMQPPTCG